MTTADPRQRLRARLWVSMVLCTWNTGRGRWQELLEALQVAGFAALQEMGDRAQWLRDLRELGYGVLDGDNRSGQSSTPLVYDAHRYVVVRRVEILIGVSQNAGVGAGPSTVKTKWLIGGVFRDRLTGRLVRVLCVHYVASQQHLTRRRIALEATRRTVEALRHVGVLTILMGDFNAVPGATTLAGFIRGGWTNNHNEGGSKPTHGRRTIDFIWWTIRRCVRFVRHWTRKSHSDHRQVFAELEVRETRRHARNRARKQRSTDRKAAA